MIDKKHEISDEALLRLLKSDQRQRLLTAQRDLLIYWLIVAVMLLGSLAILALGLLIP